MTLREFFNTKGYKQKLADAVEKEIKNRGLLTPEQAKQEYAGEITPEKLAELTEGKYIPIEEYNNVVAERDTTKNELDSFAIELEDEEIDTSVVVKEAYQNIKGINPEGDK